MRAAIEPGNPARHFPLSRSLHPMWLVAICVSLLAAAAGCDNPEVDVADVNGPSVAGNAAPEARELESEQAANAVSVSIKPWEEILAAATADGRPVVIDVWALSCEPCLKSFPELVRLHNELGDQVRCVSANIDFDGRRTRPPESYENDVREFLQANHSTLANFISATPSDEVYAELDIPSIPAVLVFDEDGKEVARFVDADQTIGFTYHDHVIPFVRTMVADAGAATSSGAAPSPDSDTSADQ